MTTIVKKSGGDFMNIKYFLANKILTIIFFYYVNYLFSKNKHAKI